jgi:hypothetical protein
MHASDADLAALLRDGAPPARDLVFELAVMARIERRRVWRELALYLVLAAAAAAILALTMPSIEQVWRAIFGGQVSNWMIALLLCAATLAGRPLLQRRS